MAPCGSSLHSVWTGRFLTQLGLIQRGLSPDLESPPGSCALWDLSSHLASLP
jgi:hypothetical protein